MSVAKPIIIVNPPIDLSERIFPLEQGDYLTRSEFERRYEAMPHLKKAELLERVVYIPSRVRWEEHGSPHAAVISWLGNYWTHTLGVSVAANATIRLDLDNETQPDAGMIIKPELGGCVKFSSEGYVVGGPELLAEVAASTASIDLHTKLNVYRRNQVQEYIVWREFDREIDWFILRETQFDRLPLSADGIYKSEVFPGLWLDPAALIAFDLAKVLQVLERGLASREHADFANKLQNLIALAR